MLTIIVSVLTGCVFLAHYGKERGLEAHRILAWGACLCIASVASLFSLGLSSIVAAVIAGEALTEFSKKASKK